jgi:hypothetical protein
MRRERAALSAITYVFVSVLAAFTLAIVLLMSAALTDAECQQWALSVLRSLLLRAFVTDPVLGCAVVATRFLACWFLLQLVSTRTTAATGTVRAACRHTTRCYSRAS